MGESKRLDSRTTYVRGCVTKHSTVYPGFPLQRESALT